MRNDMVTQNLTEAARHHQCALMFGTRVHNEAAAATNRVDRRVKPRWYTKIKLDMGVVARKLKASTGRRKNARKKRQFNEVEGKLDDNIKNSLREAAERARETVFLRNSTRIKLLFVPDGGYRACWDGVFMIALCYAIFEVPYAAVFLESSCLWTWRETVNLLCDCVFLVDILVNFNTAYFDENNVLIVNHWKIARQYMKSWFVVDLLSSLPLDRIVCQSIDGAEENASALRLFKILRLAKMVRVIRFLRVVKKWEMFVGSGILTKSIKLFKLGIFLLFCAHICGCLWMMLLPWVECRIPASSLVPGALSAPCGCDGDDCVDWNWLERYDPKLARHGTAESKYLASVYFSIVTLSTLGYGDITPSNDMERLFAIVAALMGAVVFALCIGSIANLATEGNQSENIVEDRIREVLDFLTFVKVPRRLQLRAQRQLLHASTKAPHLFHRWLQHAPLHIRKDVVTKIALEDTQKVPFFSEMDADCMARLASLFHPCLLRPGDVVFQALDTTSEMYFVVRGVLEVWNLDGTRVIEKMSVGDLIGENSMFVDDKVPFSYTTVKAKTECELLGVSRHDFHQHIKPQFPDLYAAIKDLHEARGEYLERGRMVELMCRRSAARCRGFVHQLHNLRLAMREVSKAQTKDPTLVARPMKVLQQQEGAVAHKHRKRASLALQSIRRLSARSPIGSPSPQYEAPATPLKGTAPVKLALASQRVPSDPSERLKALPDMERTTSGGSATSTSEHQSGGGGRGEGAVQACSGGSGGSGWSPQEDEGDGEAEAAEQCPAVQALHESVAGLRQRLHARVDAVEEALRAMMVALQAIPGEEEAVELTAPVWWSVAPFGIGVSNIVSA